MMGWTGYDGNGWMAVCAGIFGAALLVGVIAIVWIITRDQPKRMSEAERELQLRLARGDIDLDEFLRQQAALRH